MLISGSSYDLPHRIHVAQVYPVLSPNGSTIIVCGQEGGLSLLWRGGRSWKRSAAEPEKKQASPKANGTTTDTIILDSDSDDTSAQPAQPFVDEPAFEDEDREYDPSQPYQPIIQKLDLPLGTDVLRLSFPQLPPDLQQSNLGSLPKMLLNRLLVVVACADCRVRILSVPLIPPSPKSKARPEVRKNPLGAVAGKGLFREQMLVLSGGTRHQSIPNGISVSLTAHPIIEVDDMETDDPEPKGSALSRRSSLARERSLSREGKQGEGGIWDLLVASHSADASGLLLIHRIPLLTDGSGINLEECKTSVPWRTQFLASPAISIQFNHSLYPASRHSHLLLVEPKGIVRVFDCQPHSRAERGLWLISLYSDYETLGDGISRRKPILAAQWVLGGKAIAVLLADGEWGIWDLEDKGPKNKRDTDSWQAPTGVDLSKFAIDGRVSSSSAVKETARSSATAESRSRLAPMTPGTRKVRQETLFTGPATKSVGPARGGISVRPAQDALNPRADDETLLLWHGDSITVIPSLLTYWQNRLKGSGNLFGRGERGQAKELNNVQLGGELRNDVSLMPQHPAATAATSQATHSSVLITGEHRFVVVTPPLTEPLASAAPEPPGRSEATDQVLLAKGELDVHGIDNMLDSMTNGQQTNGMPNNGTLLRISR